MMIGYEPFLGLLAAAGLGSLIGLEREIHGQPAGLRTHMILAVGASLAAILSISYSQFLSSPNLPSDPGRIVAQVVSGVGFLGAGAILRFGVSVKGLTTASSLWTTAIIGIACGSGYFELALFTSLLVLLILTVMNRLEDWILTSYKTRTFKEFSCAIYVTWTRWYIRVFGKISRDFMGLARMSELSCI